MLFFKQKLPINMQYMHCRGEEIKHLLVMSLQCKNQSFSLGQLSFSLQLPIFGERNVMYPIDGQLKNQYHWFKEKDSPMKCMPSYESLRAFLANKNIANQCQSLVCWAFKGPILSNWPPSHQAPGNLQACTPRRASTCRSCSHCRCLGSLIS